MNSGIYKIENIINGKLYVGSAKDFGQRWERHKKDLANNRHSSIKLQRSYNKYGPDNFRFSIIEKVEYKKDLFIEREQYYIDSLDSKLNGYNIADASFGDVLSNHPNKDEIRKKIIETSRANIAKLSKEERKEKWSRPGEKNGMYGKTHSSEVRKFISDNNIGRTSPIKGKKFEDYMDEDSAKERKLKLSESAKKRTGEKNPFYGKTHSDETRNRIKEANKGNIPTNRKAVIIDEVEYPSYNHAARALDIKVTTIRWRCLSENEKFKNYQLKNEK